MPNGHGRISRRRARAPAHHPPILSPTPIPTQPLPSISLYDVMGQEIPYPEPANSQRGSYPAPTGNGGLPAPVVSIPTSAPATPTSIPTVPPPPTSAAPSAPAEPPPPTFTPPALPQTSADEHYWFRRPVAEGGIVWTDKHYPYGSTRGSTLRPHHGVEFNVGYNTPILSVASGTVVFAGADDVELVGPEGDFYGRVVVLQHDMQWQGQPIYTLYGHLNEVYVRVGQTVAAQDVIAISGATGVADGPHMHFEVRVGENSYAHTRNPLLWLYPFPDRGTIAGRVTFADGSLAQDAPISIRRLDGGVAPPMSTTTYVGETVNGDERWQENFVLDDVYAGYYEVTVRDGAVKFSQEVWVYAYQTSFVEIVLDR
jgi:murein DD-endopeptidase MepM/ murein hydrolase activator NlpD